MSSDLELPRLDLPSLKLLRLPESDGGSRPGAITRVADGDQFQQDHDDGCRTPTSEDSRIPVPTTCPPAPRRIICRKRRRTSEVEGSEIVKVSHVEVEEFFRRIECVRDRERFRVVVKGDGVGKKSVVLLQLR